MKIDLTNKYCSEAREVSCLPFHEAMVLVSCKQDAKTGKEGCHVHIGVATIKSKSSHQL